MKKELEKLIEERKSMEKKEIGNIIATKGEVLKLHKKMEKLEAELIEQKRAMEDLIWEIRNEEIKVFDYYLNICKGVK